MIKRVPSIFDDDFPGHEVGVPRAHSDLDPEFRNVMREVLENALLDVLWVVDPNKSWTKSGLSIWDWQPEFAQTLATKIKNSTATPEQNAATPRQIEKIEKYMHCYFILGGGKGRGS